MASAERVRATVVYLSPQHHVVLPVEVPAGTSLHAAVLASGLLQQVPELAGQRLDLGVFNRAREGGEPVREADRIEVYRPLAIDPKDARRVRAEVRRRRKASQAQAVDKAAT
jgi:putative ubiquitin-RnfH superfamily antitoxin RatB of RatAB toxin-antitoxin module